MRRLHFLFGLLPVVAFWTVAATHAARAGGENKIVIKLDRATLVGLPPRADHIVFGNPLIVRITTLTNAPAVLTGIGYGETNMIVLDNRGQVLMETAVLVVPPADAGPLLQRGSETTAYACHTRCEVTNDLRGHSPGTLEAAGEAQAIMNGALNAPRAAAAQGGGSL